ncbi:MAG: prolyl oligopeptidase family serine peptidase [Candidatus Omnitrophica bacterium]|nr:prolyl oligopeptidase family serine peptidase [Candidatus Omnitrophota bacterium]
MKTQEYGFNRGYGHMVQDYYVDIVRGVREERRKKLKAIRTRKEAEKYQDYALASIRKAFPLPEVKTPLNAHTTGVLEKPGYRIEKVIFESRPGFLVTGNLYIPAGMKKQAPGVLSPCGHTTLESKAYPLYQEVCLRLVKSGFVVFIYDPVSQGERDQYVHLPGENPLRANCCYAHNMMGKQLELSGDFFGAWRAWDGIRALDYLTGRPEVDSKKTGLTGNSGGGTLTTWLWALDDRFTMAAPSCFVTTFLANLENELPGDNEQCPPGILAAGLELADFYIARAPRPVLLLGQKYDFFDRRGLQEAYEDIKNFYKFFKAEDNTRIFMGNNIHGYFPDDQKKMVEFFCKYTGLKPVKKDVFALVEKRKNLWATKKGQVVPEGSKPAYKILAENARKLVQNRKKPADSEIISTVKKILGVDIPKNHPHYRILRAVVSGDDITVRYAVETEKNVRAILHKHLVEKDYSATLDVEKTVHLYLPHVSAEEDMGKDSLAKTLKDKCPLYCLDVRGLGESLPNETVDFFNAYGKDYMFNSYGLMLGNPYLGRRVYDVLQVLTLLKHEGARDIYLYGRGQGAVIALFAALLDKNIKKTVLKNAPLSFYEWTQNPVVLWPDANFPRGILKTFDIPDCIKALGKKIEVTEPWGPDMKPVKK